MGSLILAFSHCKCVAGGDGEILVGICFALCDQANQREIRERERNPGYCYTLPDCEGISAQVTPPPHHHSLMFVFATLKDILNKPC
jgi:hypothetical protein